MKKKIIIGTRGSELALAQAKWIAERLRKEQDNEIELKIIKTKGDKILDVALSKIGDKGLFVKEIENALLDKEIDLAVHSMKDLPTFLAQGLKIGATTEREDVCDALISKKGEKFSALPQGAIIGTSSLRRKAQILAARPDLKIVDLRGNLNTRLRRLEEMEMDAIILAVAGVKRLGWLDKITEILPISLSLPAVGQGALGIEIRENDTYLEKVVACLNDSSVAAAVQAERAFLRRLEGGCQIPIGCLGQVEGNKLLLTGVVAAVNGEKVLREELIGSQEEAEQLGIALAEKMLALGAKEILDQVRGG